MWSVDPFVKVVEPGVIREADGGPHGLDAGFWREGEGRCTPKRTKCDAAFCRRRDLDWRESREGGFGKGRRGRRKARLVWLGG